MKRCRKSTLSSGKKNKVISGHFISVLIFGPFNFFLNPLHNLFIAQHNNNAILQNYSAEDFYQLQPLAPKLRKRVLRDHGVGEIDPNEKLENRYLRASRQDCGCTCTDGCNPDTCSCYLEGIDCQVDREGFPCNCMIGACRNPKGQTLFDHKSVKEHYLKVLNRIPARYQHFQFQVQCNTTQQNVDQQNLGQQNVTQQNIEQHSSQSSSSIESFLRL